MPTPDARRNDERSDGKRRTMSRRRLALLKKKKRRQFQPDFHGLERRMMPSTFTVTDTSDSGAGSLRQAILDSNATPGSNTIDFNIGTGAQTISLLSPLPSITVPVFFDGTSQPGYSGAPLIDLDGTSAGTHGIDLAAGSREHHPRPRDQQLQLRRHLDRKHRQHRAELLHRHQFRGHRLRRHADELRRDRGRRRQLDRRRRAGTGNVVSGNAIAGIVIGGVGTTGNVVAGNLIGTNSAGTAALGNTIGILIQFGAANNWIGVNSVHGPMSADQGNVIAGNSVAGSVADGIVMQDSGTTGNVVAGNLIGLNVSSGGQVIDGLGDGFAGVLVQSGASGNWIGVNAAAGPGTENALQRNVISGSYVESPLTTQAPPAIWWPATSSEPTPAARPPSPTRASTRRSTMASSSPSGRRRT